MKNLIKRVLTNWVLKNYPFMVTTKVNKIKTVFVKKGKLREWRSFDENNNRVPVIM